MHSPSEIQCKARAQGWKVRCLRNVAKIPFHSQVGVTYTSGILHPNRAEDSQIWSIDIDLQSVREAVVDFEICSVLAEVRKLR